MLILARALLLMVSLAATPFEQPAAQRSGGVPAVTDRGAGAETWVLVSGIVGGVAGFGRLEARLLAAGHRVIVIDPFNLSIDSADVTFAALSRRVNRVLEEKEILDARVAGHERGAGVVLRLAANEPRRVHSLFLLDAGALSTNGSAILSTSLRIVPLIARLPGGRAFIRARFVDGLRDNAGRHEWLDEATQRAYSEPMLDEIGRVTEMAIRLSRSREPDDVRGVVARVRVKKVMVIVGAVPHASGPRPPEMIALEPLGARVRIEHLAGVGHFPHEEAPDIVAALLLAPPVTVARGQERAL